VVTGDLSGISAITYDPDPGSVDTVVVFVLPADVTANSVTLSIPGDNTALGTGPIGIQIKVDGTSTLVSRTLQITVNLTLSGGAGGSNDRELIGITTLTIWDLNGTVLIANFLNGNNVANNARIYLFNPSSNGGDISVRVFTLPRTGPPVLIGSVAVGNLGGLSGRNIHVDGDLLQPLIDQGALQGDGTPLVLPYVENGGNLVAEVTIEADGVTGAAQVFGDAVAFGTYILPAL
jgi:hypothetical protein